MLTLSHITKSYDEKHHSRRLVLDDVSLDIPQGSIFGLLGPNGAGKTTLIRIINRILLPDSGTIVINGHPLTATDVQRIGYLPEERGLYPKMRVGEQALYLCQLKGMDKGAATESLRQWFQIMDRGDLGPVDTLWNRTVCRLSKGMQQKVQFVTTVAHNPDLLILDEPFSGFDPIGADLLKQQVLRLGRQGTTVMLSTHNMAQAEQLCSHIAILANHHIAFSGTIDEARSLYPDNTLEETFVKVVNSQPRGAEQ